MAEHLNAGLIALFIRDPGNPIHVFGDFSGGVRTPCPSLDPRMSVVCASGISWSFSLAFGRVVQQECRFKILLYIVLFVCLI